MASVHLAQEIFKLIYPVGSIYLSDNATNPSTLFGGTWARLTGGFIYGSVKLTGGNTCSTGNIGAATNTANHILTINEMPKHSFRIPHVAYYNNCAISGGGFTETREAQDKEGQAADVANNSGWHIMSIGNNAGHNHPIPYIACSIWRRTA